MPQRGEQVVPLRQAAWTHAKASAVPGVLLMTHAPQKEGAQEQMRQMPRASQMLHGQRSNLLCRLNA